MATVPDLQAQLQRIAGRAAELSVILGSGEFASQSTYLFIQSLTNQVERELGYLVTECVKDSKK